MHGSRIQLYSVEGILICLLSLSLIFSYLQSLQTDSRYNINLCCSFIIQSLRSLRTLHTQHSSLSRISRLTQCLNSLYVCRTAILLTALRNLLETGCSSQVI